MMKSFFCTIGFTLLILSQTAYSRSIYLNGTDISSAINQELKNVDIKISKNGDLFIHAPHYQVNEENTYTPLSKFYRKSLDHREESQKIKSNEKQPESAEAKTTEVNEPASAKVQTDKQ